MSTKAQQLFETYREVQSAFEDVELSEESLIKLALSVFIDANKAAPKIWPVKPTATVGNPYVKPTVQEGAQRTVTGILGDKRMESLTSKDGKPYTKFYYIVDGVEFTSVSKKVSETLSKATLGKSRVELILQKSGKFENLVDANIVLSGPALPEDEVSEDDIGF